MSRWFQRAGWLLAHLVVVDTDALKLQVGGTSVLSSSIDACWMSVYYTWSAEIFPAELIYQTDRVPQRRPPWMK